MKASTPPSSRSGICSVSRRSVCGFVFDYSRLAVYGGLEQTAQWVGLCSPLVDFLDDGWGIITAPTGSVIGRFFIGCPKLYPQPFQGFVKCLSKIVVVIEYRITEFIQ